MVRVPLCRFARKESTGWKADRRQEILSLEALRTCSGALMIYIVDHLPGFVRYLAVVFKEDGCDGSVIADQQRVTLIVFRPFLLNTPQSIDLPSRQLVIPPLL